MNCPSSSSIHYDLKRRLLKYTFRAFEADNLVFIGLVTLVWSLSVLLVNPEGHGS